jgi:hypothetical protein
MRSAGWSRRTETRLRSPVRRQVPILRTPGRPSPAGDVPDLARDRVGYRQAAVGVTDEEFDAMVADLAAVLRPRMGHRPGGGRRRRLVTTINLPAD